MIGVLPIALWILSMIFQACPCPKASDVSRNINSAAYQLRFGPTWMKCSVISGHLLSHFRSRHEDFFTGPGHIRHQGRIRAKAFRNSEGRRSVKSSNSGFFCMDDSHGGGWWWWWYNRPPGNRKSRTNTTDWAMFLNGARQEASAPARFYLSLHASE